MPCKASQDLARCTNLTAAMAFSTVGASVCTILVRLSTSERRCTCPRLPVLVVGSLRLTVDVCAWFPPRRAFWELQPLAGYPSPSGMRSTFFTSMCPASRNRLGICPSLLRRGC